MKPSQLSSILRRIAAAIDNSKSPSRELVAEDLRRVISNLIPTDDVETANVDPAKPAPEAE